jgi:TetR/AcrR family transcriptional regulator, regulator of autoinduction and epiphytic fitness
MAGTVKRRYDSTRRDEQARETRERIIRAAHDLFVAQGYGRTTIADIARAGGVSPETVYASFGNKATLLRRAWFLMFRGDETDLPLYDRPQMQEILAIRDLAERTRAHAAFVTANNRRSAPLLRAMEGAAASEQGAAEMLAEWAERRLDVATKYAHAAAATGQLAVTEAECRDVLYATMDGVLWQRLVEQRRWSDQRYATWLSGAWQAMFVRTNPA